MRRSLLVTLATTALAATACGGGSSKPPPNCTQTGCGTGSVCETVAGAPACVDPIYVSGRVYDLTNANAASNGVGGAHVVGQDVDGAPVSSVATSDAAGAYELTVRAPRNADGSPASGSVTLRADAAGYATFPSGLRIALPVALTGATHSGGRWTVKSALTDVGLSPIAGAPTGQISGTVQLPTSGGVLVVAECGGKGYTAVPDANGAYTIFNVPAGTCAVTAYRQGASYVPVTGLAVGTGTATANLNLSSAATATVNGSVQIVGTTFWPTTSVLLVVASTYDSALARGIAPPGLKAANVGNGSWSIAGVPSGHYRVLAAFETDYLVRDPSDIGGTAVLDFWVAGGLVYLTDPSAGSPTAVSSLAGFKITGAVRLLGPIADATGACATLTSATLPADPGTLPVGGCKAANGTPTLTWEAYSSTSTYDVKVVDQTGGVAWSTTAPYAATSSSVTVPTALASGIYQVRLVAHDSRGKSISASEDLLGVFTVP